MDRLTTSKQQARKQSGTWARSVWIGEPRQAGPVRRSEASLSARPLRGRERARWRKPKPVSATLRCGARAEPISRHLFDSHTGSSGRLLRGERHQVACFSPVGCWCGRSGGAPAGASAMMTAKWMAHRRVSRSNGTPRWEARGSMFGGR